VYCALYAWFAESPYSRLVETLAVNNVIYNYYDVTAIAPNYGMCVPPVATHFSSSLASAI